MNTLILTGSLSRDGGGVFTVLQGLVPALAERGVDVALHGLRDAGWALDADSWRNAKVYAHQINGPAAFGYSAQMRRAVDQTPADVVHCHGLWRYSSLLARRAQRGKRIPLVVSPHGMLNEQSLHVARLKKQIALLAYERDHLMHAQCLHALVDTELDEIRRFGFRGPVCVVPNGVPAAGERPAQAAPWRQQSLPVAEDAPVLLFLGRKHPLKNPHGLLEAWKILEAQEAVGPWHLVVAGWGDPADEAALNEQFRQLGLRTAHLMGPMFGDDKAAALYGAAGFALVSRNEALPVAVLEAWSYGLPAVLSPECNVPTAFEIGAALAADTEPTAMAQRLRQFIETPPAERRAMGDKARQLVQEQYAWSGVAERFREVYHWLQHGGTRPDCIDPGVQ